MNYLSLEVQYIGASKIEPAAGRCTFVWKKSNEKDKAKLEANIASVLADIDAQIKHDKSELGPEEVPKAIDITELRKKIEQINTRL